MAVIRWLGHAAFEIEIGGKLIIVDPFLSGNPLAAKKASEITEADIVAVTHDHGDHLGDAVEIAKATGAALASLYEVAEAAARQGVKDAVGMNVGGRAEVRGVEVIVTPAVHTGHCCGFVFRAGGVSIYHAGDTALFGDMRLIGELYGPDVALLPIGSHYTMGPAEAAIAASFIRPRFAIPMHYNTFPVIEQDPKEFAKLAAERAPGVRVVVLKPGEAFEFGPL